MAFTVEDGTRPAGANSLITEAFFRSHNGDRGRDAAVSDIAVADVETACVRASDYAEKRFGKRFRGLKSTSDQVFQWPRIDAFDNAGHSLTGIPLIYQKAIAEYAWISVGTIGPDLAPPVASAFATVDSETGAVSDASGITSKKEKVGPIEEETDFGNVQSDKPMTSSGNMVQSIPEYPEADLWIEELLRPRFSGELSRG